MNRMESTDKKPHVTYTKWIQLARQENVTSSPGPKISIDSQKRWSYKVIIGSCAKSKQMLHSKLPASLLYIIVAATGNPKQEGLGVDLLVDSPNPFSIYITQDFSEYTRQTCIQKLRTYILVKKTSHIQDVMTQGF